MDQKSQGQLLVSHRVGPVQRDFQQVFKEAGKGSSTEKGFTGSLSPKLGRTVCNESRGTGHPLPSLGSLKVQVTGNLCRWLPGLEKARGDPPWAVFKLWGIRITRKPFKMHIP